MFIAFYSTRLILSALGKSDFGLYQLVAGVITMLSFLNAAMTTSTQRFFSFHKSNQDRFFKQKIFKNSLTLHILVALVLFLFIKIAGVFLFNDFLNNGPNKTEKN